jgi:hypothetical protein
MKINSTFKHRLIFSSAIGFSIIFLLFVMGCVWIGNGVKKQCQDAKREYDGNCQQALIKLLSDEDKSFRVRNSAVWALGQLGDNKALPVLQSYYTGNIPAKESLEKSISQYELKKAINLCSGGFNITSVFWRFGDDLK